MGEELTLVARKACFGLPTACPSCLPVYIYLKFAQLPFNLEFNLIHPDSGEIPYVESGTYVAFNNEKSGVIESLKEDGVVNLDANVNSNPEWISTKAMIDSWLADALLYELWVGTDGSSAKQIYYSDIAWPIGKFLFFHQVHIVKQRLGITKENADKREEEIYKKATLAYGALSSSLGDQSFFFENRPTSLDANFLGHAIFTIEALPAASVLRNKLLEHSNLVQYASKLRTEFLNGETTSATPSVRADPSSSSFPRPAATSTSSSKPKSKPKKEKTEEEKKFRRRAKYFLVTQLVAVLVFMSLLGGSDEAELDLEDDGGSAYD